MNATDIQTDDYECFALRHRHGRAWSWLIAKDHTEPEVDPSERDHNARRRVVLGLVAGWCVGLAVLAVVAG